MLKTCHTNCVVSKFPLQSKRIYLTSPRSTHCSTVRELNLLLIAGSLKFLARTMKIYRETARLILGSHSSPESKYGDTFVDSPSLHKSKLTNHVETKVPSFGSGMPHALSRGSSTASECSTDSPTFSRVGSNEIHSHAALTANPSRAIGLPHLIIGSPAQTLRTSTLSQSSSPTSTSASTAHIDFKTIRGQAKQNMYSLGIKNHFLPSTIDQYRDLFNGLLPNYDGFVSRSRLQFNFDSAKFYETISPETHIILTNFIGTKGELSVFESNDVNFEEFLHSLSKLGLRGDGSTDNLKLRDILKSLQIFVTQLNRIPTEKQEIVENYDQKLHRLISTRYNRSDLLTAF